MVKKSFLKNVELSIDLNQILYLESCILKLKILVVDIVFRRSVIKIIFQANNPLFVQISFNIQNVFLIFLLQVKHKLQHIVIIT